MYDEIERWNWNDSNKMRISTKILIIVASAVICAGAVSCKKDSDSTTSESFESGPVFDLPVFVNPGDVIECIPSGVSRDDDGDWGYYWTNSPLTDVNDTTKLEGEASDGRFTFVVKDTLCEVTVKCVAFAEGYYTSSSSKTTTIVKAGIGGSITDDGITEESPVIEDERDGKEYPVTEIGDSEWFAKNLAYEGSGLPYVSCNAMTDVFGMYYTWEEARNACPEGWRLPGKEDWDNLATSLGAGNASEGSLDYMNIAGDLMVNAYFNGTRLWEYWPAVNITNKAGFSALPTGLATISSQGASFGNVLSYAAWWTDEDVDEERAVYRYINVNLPHVFAGYGYKSNMLLPVRCVREN